MTTNEKWPIGVFTSIDAGLGVHLDVVDELKIPTVQLHAPKAEKRTIEQAKILREKLTQLGVELTAVFGGFQGESYQSISIVEQTVGLVPREQRANRLDEMKQISDFAGQLECDVIALHLGFVPENCNGDDYNEIVNVTQDLCNYAKGNGQNLHLETGQETADALLKFISDTGCDNLFINFDPANMILYGTGEPLAALMKLKDFVRSVHCKDANWSSEPGKTWGEEAPLGKGSVDIEGYLKILSDINYVGPLTIEREIPQDPERQKKEILHAVNLLENLKSSLA